MLERAACIDDLRALARRNLPTMVFDYIDGAAGSETTAARNRYALEQVLLKPEILIDLTDRTLSSALFGQSVEMPIIIGPTGLNGAYWPKGDLCLARAAKSANIPFVMSTAATVGLDEMSRAAGELRWFQLYMLKDRALVEALLDRLMAHDFQVLELTVDTPIAGRRNRDIRNGFSMPFRWTLRNFVDTACHPAWALSMLRVGQPILQLFSEAVGALPRGKTISEVMQQQISGSFTWTDLAWLRNHWKGKLVLKGISSADHVLRALECGVDGVVVSNHGGRQLEGGEASIEYLPPVVKAADRQCTVLIDSGFRSGIDVAKAIALGADGVQLGRAALYALAAGGEVGVQHALKILAAELEQGMALCGACSIAQLAGRALGSFKLGKETEMASLYAVHN